MDAVDLDRGLASLCCLLLVSRKEPLNDVTFSRSGDDCRQGSSAVVDVADAIADTSKDAADARRFSDSTLKSLVFSFRLRPMGATIDGGMGGRLSGAEGGVLDGVTARSCRLCTAPPGLAAVSACGTSSGRTYDVKGLEPLGVFNTGELRLDRLESLEDRLSGDTLSY